MTYGRTTRRQAKPAVPGRLAAADLGFSVACPQAKGHDIASTRRGVASPRRETGTTACLAGARWPRGRFVRLSRAPSTPRPQLVSAVAGNARFRRGACGARRRSGSATAAQAARAFEVRPWA